MDSGGRVRGHAAAFRHGALAATGSGRGRIGAVVMVGLFTALILHPDRYLLAAAGSAATVMLPGLLLVAREPRAQA